MFCIRVNTFTFMHLADAFIQSDLQYIQAINFLSVGVFPGNWTHDLYAANAMLYHWATGTLFTQEQNIWFVFYSDKNTKDIWVWYVLFWLIEQSFRIVPTREKTVRLWYFDIIYVVQAIFWKCALRKIISVNKTILSLFLFSHPCSVSASLVFKILRRRNKDPVGRLSAAQRGAL